MDIIEVLERLISQPATNVPANEDVSSAAPAARPPAATQALRDRFLRNFEKVRIEDVLITDPNNPEKAPMEHFHIRFYLSKENIEVLDPDQRLMFMSAISEQGKGVLAQYGLTNLEEINYDKNKGLLQFDCDFSSRISNRAEAAQAIQKDLQAGIDRARAAQIARFTR